MVLMPKIIVLNGFVLIFVASLIEHLIVKLEHYWTLKGRNVGIPVGDVCTILFVALLVNLCAQTNETKISNRAHPRCK